MISDKKQSGQIWLILICGVTVAIGLFLLHSASLYKTGFPLDDAWIHQTYARNLARLGEWSFIPGKPSAGSTSPLWSVLLALGYRINIPPIPWAYLLGAGCLFALGVVGELLYRSLAALSEKRFPWFGLFLVFEWHLVWAAASGMETLLHAFGILLTLYLISLSKRKWFWIGLLIGAIVWVRPDGLTLLGPAVFVLILESEFWQERLLGIGKLAQGFLVGFIPYLFFNMQLSGSMWPNTFYAKQAEYAILYQFPLIDRLINLYSLPLVGAGAMLLPGIFYGLWWAVQQRCWTYLGAALWWMGYTGLYAWRLPVIYQHGRYLMPAMPVYFLLGAIGTTQLFRKYRGNQGMAFILQRAWVVSSILLCAVFFVMGARAYAEDVAIIESEMVDSARWIANNTPENALIAAHDIGAMGYFANRDLIDLAGLVSPDVIPFIRDENQLAQYITENGADYLVVFPDWYQYLHKNGEMLYQTGGIYSPEAGGQNMTVYRWGQ